MYLGIMMISSHIRIGYIARNLARRFITSSVEDKFTVKSPFPKCDYVSNLSIADMILPSLLDEKISQNVAIVDGYSNEELKFGEINTTSYKFAAYLSKNGITKGSVVAIMSPNTLHYSTAFLGISIVGGICTPINPLYTTDEISFQINLTSTKLIITHSMCLDKVLSVAKPRNIPVIIFGSSANDAISYQSIIESIKTPILPSLFDVVDPDSTLVIPFSSGTTGVPKGVVLSHRNVTSNMLQLRALDKPKDHASFLVPLPFFHIYGMVPGLLYLTYIQKKMVFMPGFDLVKFLELIQKHKTTQTFTVPPIILALAKHPTVDKYDLSSLEVINCAAAPLGEDIQKLCAIRLKCGVKQGWGMTELSPVGTVCLDEYSTDIERIKGKSGMLVYGTEARVMDPVTKQYIDPSTEAEGEILIRGPQVMQGYYNNPEATKSTIREDGFMHTGDIGFFNQEGWLTITDRIKELIKYKGFQVAPAELEALIASMPEVKDCVVIPVLDDEAGEIPRAYVVRQDGSDISDQAIMDYVTEKAAPHKRLRGGVRFVDAIPRSPSGKILRRVQIEIDRKK